MNLVSWYRHCIIRLHARERSCFHAYSSNALDFVANKYDGNCAVELAWFYFDFLDQEKRNTTNTLRSIITRLSRKRATFFGDSANAQYSSHLSFSVMESSLFGKILLRSACKVDSHTLWPFLVALLLFTAVSYAADLAAAICTLHFCFWLSSMCGALIPHWW